MVSASVTDPDQMMAAADLGKVIAMIIARHSKSVLDDRRKLLGLLRDHVPGEVRGVKLLMASYDQNTPQGFLAHGAPPTKIMIDQQANALVANAGLQRDLAYWATEAWSFGLYGKAASIAPAIPAADDLTWGSEAVSGGSSIPLAPSANGGVAPSAAAPQMAPSVASAKTVAAKKPVDKFLVGCLVITALVGAVGVVHNMSNRQPAVHEEPTAPQDAPAQPANPPAAPQDAPAQPVNPPQQQPATPAPQAAGDPVQEDGTPWIITSMSDDPKQWPEFNGANHPKGVANDWEFSFNSRLSDGRLAVFAIDVSLDANLKSGNGYVRGLDLAVKDTNRMSVSPWSPVVRELHKESKTFFTTLSAPKWDKNETGIPAICVSFSSGANAKNFEPEGGLFCVSEYSNGSCSINIGCGRVTK